MRTGSSMPPHAHAQSSRHPHNQSYRHLPVPKDSKAQNGRRPVYLHEHRRPPPRGDGVGGGAGGGGAGLLQGFPTAGRHQQVQGQQQQVPPGQGQGQGQPGPGFQWPSWASFRKQEGQLPPHGADGATPQAANGAGAGAGAGPGRYYSQQQPSRQRNPRDLVAAAVSKSAHANAPPLPSSLQAQGNNNTPHLDAYIASQLGGRAPDHHDEGVEDAMDNYHDNDHNNDDLGGQSVKSMVTDYTAGTTWTAGTTTTYGGGMSVKTSTHVPKPDKAGYNRKWTDVAYKKYMLGMQFYRAQGE